MADSANTTTLPESNEFLRLAEDAGAQFTASGNGTWSAMDRDGIIVVRGALSRAEAARLFVEDWCPAATPDAEKAGSSWMRRFFRAGGR